MRPATINDRSRLYALGSGSMVADSLLLVVVKQGEVVGGIGVSSTPDPWTAEVSGLFVTPGCRRQGLGRLLLRGACANIVARGCRLAIVSVDAGDGVLCRLFESAGWRTEGKADPGGAARPCVYRHRVLSSMPNG